MRFLHEHQKGKLKCPYKGCEKEFDKPTLTTDSSRIPRETHYACPHCMSNLNIVTKDSKVIGVNAAEQPNGFDLHAKSNRAQAQMHELNTLEITLNEKSGGTGSDYEMPFRVSERRKTPQEKAEQPSEFQCPFHFGYLNVKNKNESVPEKCFECPRSIDCMLSEFKKSQQSLEEIKKWY
jgi:CxxC motif-containing protein